MEKIKIPLNSNVGIYRYHLGIVDTINRDNNSVYSLFFLLLIILNKKPTYRLIAITPIHPAQK